jgi:hypothetical protein
MKLKRGQKLCKNCNNINGARAHTCKHCNSEFIANVSNNKNKVKRPRKPKKYIAINWRELMRGDKIKVIGRSGNYYVGADGDKKYLTDAGIYTISDIDDNGLRVYADGGGYGYIYMGKEMQSDLIDNMYRSPHKILKVNIPVSL